MEPPLLILSVISLANIAILSALIMLFARMFAATKAQLPLGMIVVAVSLLLHNAIGAAGFFSHDMLISESVFPYMLGVGITELAGLSIFLKITMD
ncbi:MAG: hypothetical protein OXP12_02270 [Thaumarchaeota archaeon]|nr:hypothetical protein [Nitrososphaerota archaeon]MDE0267248.1 hypothetical protein [Nitrososphaerota archaeon]MDE0526998.1 hypothetical protein [Nitrososphaerota archaeon]